jgi:hypothetical protein
MKKKLVLVILFTNVLAFGQNVKSERLNYLKIIPPSIINIDKPVDMTIQHISNSNELTDLIKKSYISLSPPNYINNNNSNPKYIGVISYIDNPAITIKTDKNVIIKSDIEAVIYIIESGKGVFYQDVIKLSNKDNRGNYGNSSEFSSVINKSLTDNEAAELFLNGTFPNPAKVEQVDIDQLKRLSKIAYRRINSKITTTDEEDKISFNYLKKDKEFDSSQFDKAYAILKSNLNPINIDSLEQASIIFESEYNKYSNNDPNKKIRKYKLALLENLISISYCIDDYSQFDKHLNDLKELDDRQLILKWYSREKNIYTKRLEENQLGNIISYYSIPKDIIDNSTNKVILLQKNNPVDQRIENIDFQLNRIYIEPIISLNTFAHKLKTLETKNLFIAYQNNLFSDIIEYMLSYKENLTDIGNSQKKKMQGFIDFCESFNKELIDKKIYKNSDKIDYRTAKIREYISLNYSIEDFTKYTPQIFDAIELATTTKNEVSTKVYQNALKINGIVQLRKILIDDLYMEDERVKAENILNNSIEEDILKSKYAKNRAYFEFKKSIQIFEHIKGKRTLAEEEYINYEILLLNLISNSIYS